MKIQWETIEAVLEYVRLAKVDFDKARLYLGPSELATVPVEVRAYWAYVSTTDLSEATHEIRVEKRRFRLHVVAAHYPQMDALPEPAFVAAMKGFARIRNAEYTCMMLVRNRERERTDQP